MPTHENEGKVLLLTTLNNSLLSSEFILFLRELIPYAIEG